MSLQAEAILEHLRSVAAERALLAADAALAARMQAVKAYQHQRFEQSYADLLADPGTRQAALFFLSDLYGVQDFSARDAQFARIVPALDRLFPAAIVRTVRDLADLHALSESLDRQMAQTLASPDVNAERYGAAWCRVGQPALRERQVQLMSDVGSALVGYTRSRVLRHSLRLMAGPARLAGLEALHGFLERGFDTFRGLRVPQAFLAVIVTRERALAKVLFDQAAAPS